MDIRFHSRSQEELVSDLFKRILQYYGDRLIALAVFGSYASGKARLNSDLDLLLVLTEPLSRKQKMEEFDTQVESPFLSRLQALDAEGVRMELSPIILDKDQARAFNPLYLDMVNSRAIIHDVQEFLRRLLDTIQVRSEKWGSRKIPIAGHWAWDIKPAIAGVRKINYDE
jgi:hypothetical protein